MYISHFKFASIDTKHAACMVDDDNNLPSPGPTLRHLRTVLPGISRGCCECKEKPNRDQITPT